MKALRLSDRILLIDVGITFEGNDILLYSKNKHCIGVNMIIPSSYIFRHIQFV